MRAPAFQFYPSDFMMGTMDMSAEAVGGYIRLLCYQWDKGGVPDDDAAIARIGGCGGNAVASLRHKFGICSDGLLRNARLELVRQKQDAFRKSQAGNAEKRWKSHKRDAVAYATAMPTHMPNGCSPSPSPSPISDSETERPQAARFRREIPDLKQWLEECQRSHPDWPVRDATGAWEHYEKIGWKAGKNPVVKWKMCVSTCYRTWLERGGIPAKQKRGQAELDAEQARLAAMHTKTL